VLAAHGVLPDFEGPPGTDYVHRRAGATEIYFVRNAKPDTLCAEFTLRVKGKAPELWHPDSGRIDAEPAYQPTADGRTRLPLTLEPNGSVFVVFRSPGTGRMAGPTPDTAGAPVPVDGPWTVSFTPGWGAPAQATFDKLIS
jgi:hypothetical protein